MQIRIRHEDGRETCIQLDASQTLRIGTRGSADVVLNGAEVSPLHLGILLRHGVFTAVAFKKVGKIRVNGTLVRKAVLHDGDQIEVGANLIDVRGPQADAASDGTPAWDKGIPAESPSGQPKKSPLPPASQSSELLDGLADLDDELALLGETSDELFMSGAARPAAGDLSAASGTRPPALRDQVSTTGRLLSSNWCKSVLVLLLIVLPLAVLICVCIWQWPAAEDRFLIADQHYQRGDYPRAAEAFAAFLSRPGREAYRDEAHVKQQLAILLNNLDRGVEATVMWQQLETSVAGWGSGRHCAYAQSGLAELIPPIATDLVRQAQFSAEQGADEAARESLRQAGEALRMMYRLVPPDRQRRSGIVQLQLHFTRLQRELQRPSALRLALEQLEQLSSSGNIAAAYTIRGDLLARYPELASDGRLLSAMRAVGRAARAAVAVPVETGLTNLDPEQVVWLADATATQPVDRAGGAEQPPQCVAALLPELGAIYALDMANERILWRYMVGFHETCQPIEWEGNSFILVDGVRSQLVRVNAATGDPIWHATLPPLAAAPVVERDRLLVAHAGGMVAQIDLAHGETTARLQLPQALSVGPAVDPSEPRCYQAAEHSLIYVLSLDQSKCLSSYYLGHELGTVNRSPFVVGQYLLVCEQIGPAETEVHVLLRGDELQPIQTLNLPMCVTDSPAVIDGAVYLPTLDGRIQILRRTGGDDERPPFQADGVIAGDATQRSAGARVIVAAIDGQLWVAGDGVAQYPLAEPDSSPRLLGDPWRGFRVTHLARSATGAVAGFGRLEDLPGYVVCGWKSGAREAPLRMLLAAPPAAPPLVSTGSDDYWVLTANGGVHRGNVRELLDGRRGTCIVPPQVAELTAEKRKEVSGTTVWCGTTAMMGPSIAGDRVLLVREEGHNGAPAWCRLPLPLACPPAVLNDRFLLAFDGGPLCLADGVRGEVGSQPFLPDLHCGDDFSWKMPAVLDDGRVVVSDGGSRLFLLKSRADATGLELISQSLATAGFPAGLVCVQGGVWGVDDRHQLQHITLPDLRLQAGPVLAGELQWGPVVAGDRGYLATTQGELVCFGGPAAGDWVLRLDMGPLVGACAIDSHYLAVASSQGVIRLVDAVTGQTLGSPLAIEQRLACGPLVMHGHLTVMTQDGCLLLMRGTIDELVKDQVKGVSPLRGGP